jgi:tRNA (mo5U34)-methyltransferase
MPLMKERRIRLAGLDLAAAVDAERADRITHSRWWRFVGRPPLRLLDRLTTRSPAGGSVQPEMRSHTWTISNGSAPPAAARPVDAAAAELQERVSKYYWYHTLDLGNGVVTPGFVDNRDQVHTIGLPQDLTGKRCLDVGTFDGFWAFEMERRGAKEVIALDLNSLEDMDLRPQSRDQFIEEAIRQRGTAVLGETFALAKEILGSKVQRKVLSVYELSPDFVGTFDVVHCSDVVPHLRDPQLAFQNIFSVTDGMALIGSAFDPELDQLREPLVRVCPSGGDFVWWWFSAMSLRLMMEQSGFQPVEEVARVRVDNRAGRFWKVFLRGQRPA